MNDLQLRLDFAKSAREVIALRLGVHEDLLRTVLEKRHRLWKKRLEPKGCALHSWNCPRRKEPIYVKMPGDREKTKLWPHMPECYRQFRIPREPLRQVQVAIAEHILRPLIANLVLPIHHGFLEGRSVRTSALVHYETGHEYFLRVDLASAFGQINHRRIEALFRFGAGFGKEESKMLAALVTPPGSDWGGLPQGAVTSPFIYVLVIDHLFSTRVIPNLPGVMTVTAYADDFVFSSNEPFGPGRTRAVYRAFAKAGLRINTKKTLRFVRRGGAVRLPGVVIRPRDAESPLGLSRVKLEQIKVVLDEAAKGRVYADVARGNLSWLRFAYGDNRENWPTWVLLAAERYYASKWKRRRPSEADEEARSLCLSYRAEYIDWGPGEAWENLLLEPPPRLEDPSDVPDWL